MGATTVTKRATSAFCFGNLPFAPRNATATVDYNAASQTVPSGKLTAQLEVDPPGSAASDCNSGENVEVVTADSASNTGVPVSFYITFN
jgi:hypothetical protein